MNDTLTMGQMQELLEKHTKDLKQVVEDRMDAAEKNFKTEFNAMSTVLHGRLSEVEARQQTSMSDHDKLIKIEGLVEANRIDITGIGKKAKSEEAIKSIASRVYKEETKSTATIIKWTVGVVGALLGVTGLAAIIERFAK